jgi:hypothetical protein
MVLILSLRASSVSFSTKVFNALSGVLRVSKTRSTSNDWIELLGPDELIVLDMMLFILNYHILF